MSRNQNETARRRFVKLLGAGTLIGTSGSAAVAARGDAGGDDDTGPGFPHCDPGLVTLESNADFKETVDRVEPALEARDLMLVTSIDHAANAASVDETLPPTTLFLFGNPAVGTPLMQARRSIAIDLPQKLLVWESDGDVFVTYNDPAFLARRHDLEGVDEQLQSVTEALSDLADAVARGK